MTQREGLFGTEVREDTDKSYAVCQMWAGVRNGTKRWGWHDYTRPALGDHDIAMFSKPLGVPRVKKKKDPGARIWLMRIPGSAPPPEGGG